jgi:hypothetical protein
VSALVVYRLQPGQKLREAAALAGSRALDYSYTGRATSTWGDSCDTFPTVDDMFADG